MLKKLKKLLPIACCCALLGCQAAPIINASAPDVKALYINQLTRLMDSPCTVRTGLGIYRIAYEGCFALSCQHKEGRVHIKALRNLQAD